MPEEVLVRQGAIQNTVDDAIAAEKGAANGIAPLDANALLALVYLAGITDAQIAAANKDGAAATPSLRTLGTGAQQAAAGDDGRLSDARTPTAHSPTHATGGSDAITPADIGASPTGHTHAQLHDRVHNLFSTDHADVDETDVPADNQVLTFNATTGMWEARAAGGVPSATETNEGTVEHATEAEVQAGTAGNLVATAARLKAEFDRRLTSEAWIAPTLLNGWSNEGGAFQVAGYYKDPLGIVHLTGLIQNGTIGSDAFILPAGYRPGGHILFATDSFSGGDIFSRLDVRSDGGVRPMKGGTDYFSIAGVSFRAEL